MRCTKLVAALFGGAAALQAQSPADSRGSGVADTESEAEALCPPEGTCSGGPCQKALEAVAPKRTLVENFRGPGLNFAAVSHAVCLLPNDHMSNSKITMPDEAAQRIYKCWSWWRQHPKAVPVLIDDTARLVLEEHSSLWVRGLLEPLRKMGVQILKDGGSEQLRAVAVSPRVHTGIAGKEMEWFTNETHATELRDRILAMYAGEEPPKLRNKTYVALARGLGEEVRIGFVQRELHKKSVTSRRLLGESAMLSALSQLGPVDTTTFDHKTFQEQAEFMNSHDVIVSPHGDQLASIPMMPDCGAVVEVFPKGYFVPGVFGSMAKNSGKDYLAVYSDSGDPIKEGKPDPILLAETRDVAHFCASVGEVTSAVQALKARRLECLAKRSIQA